MDLNKALHLVSNNSRGKKVDKSELSEAKKIVSKASEEVPCPVCNYYKVTLSYPRELSTCHYHQVGRAVSSLKIVSQEQTSSMVKYTMVHHANSDVGLLHTKHVSNPLETTLGLTTIN